MALDELKSRIEGDQSLSIETKAALLADLSAGNPAELANFVGILTKQGAKDEANAA
jgi:hypothetical protein